MIQDLPNNLKAVCIYQVINPWCGSGQTDRQTDSSSFIGIEKKMNVNDMALWCQK